MTTGDKGAKVGHTAGPWKWTDYSGNGQELELEGPEGHVMSQHVGNVSEEDALLIASSPELKELLSLAVCYVDNEELKGQIYRLLGKVAGVGHEVKA